MKKPSPFVLVLAGLVAAIAFVYSCGGSGEGPAGDTPDEDFLRSTELTGPPDDVEVVIPDGINPEVVGYIYDKNVDGLGDELSWPCCSTGLTPCRVCQPAYTMIVGDNPKGIMEFNLSTISLITNTLHFNLVGSLGRGSGWSDPNNAALTHTIYVYYYGGNGSLDLEDYEASATLLGSRAWTVPPGSYPDTCWSLSLDATSAVQSLIANETSWLGIRLENDGWFAGLNHDDRSSISEVPLEVYYIYNSSVISNAI